MESDPLLRREYEGEAMHTQAHAPDLDLQGVTVGAGLDLLKVNVDVVRHAEIHVLWNEIAKLQRDVLAHKVKVRMCVHDPRDGQDTQARNQGRDDDQRHVLPQCSIQTPLALGGLDQRGRQGVQLLYKGIQILILRKFDRKVHHLRQKVEQLPAQILVERAEVSVEVLGIGLGLRCDGVEFLQ